MDQPEYGTNHPYYFDIIEFHGSAVCSGVAVDSSGNVYCAGYTNGALGEANLNGNNDAFVMKLNSSGKLMDP